MTDRFSFLQQASFRTKTAYIIATGFGSGLSPKAPGTMGSLAALLPIWGAAQFGVWGILFLSIFFFITGWDATNIVLKTQKIHDPGYVVIDEFVGQALAFLFVAYLNMPWYYYLIGFALFRFFDIVKIWPASYFDKKVCNAFGVMTDDVVAGLYAGLVLYGLHFII